MARLQQILLVALSACLAILSSHVSAAGGVRIMGQARRSGTSTRQRGSVPADGRGLSSKSAMSMMSKSAAATSRTDMMSKSGMSMSMMQMSTMSGKQMRMMMMMGGGGNFTNSTVDEDDFPDMEDKGFDIGADDEGIRTFPIASRLVFTFFPGTGREPTEEETLVVEEATERFFRKEFKNDPNFGPAFEDFELSEQVTIYREEANPDKFSLEFVALVKVDADAAAESRKISAKNALGVMSQSNFKEYIGDYVRSAGGIWNEFYYTHAVRFRGAGRNDS